MSNISRCTDSYQRGAATGEVILCIVGVLAIVIAVAMLRDQWAWSDRCEAAGGAPIIDRTGNRVCFGKSGGIIEIPR